ncbi:hypothetical protein LZ24_00592 [Desulfobotulus alkaliphilus]|uniref:Uncharacterized protein n=1 Tax=Desulfobotulus alkaliphilus TaxID=622671 RepID=A0A562S2H5_9BACT|nr:hypothetical protein [Desulfobotulus alkaliphilus]TWI75545.1 hypothetical protein LZ24_00592 [Desulfobotulus alkaliphilus]
MTFMEIEDARKNKIGDDQLEKILETIETIAVSSGKKFYIFNNTISEKKLFTDKIKGPGGNLRAPALSFNHTLIVGFHKEMYERFLFIK